MDPKWPKFNSGLGGQLIHIAHWECEQNPWCFVSIRGDSSFWDILPIFSKDFFLPGFRWCPHATGDLCFPEFLLSKRYSQSHTRYDNVFFREWVGDCFVCKRPLLHQHQHQVAWFVMIVVCQPGTSNAYWKDGWWYAAVFGGPSCVCSGKVDVNSELRKK